MKRESVKDILLNSGTISISYKESMKSWVGESNIHILRKNEYWDTKIILTVPNDVIRGRKEYDISDIDNVIDLYISEVLSEKNLYYKIPETIEMITNEGRFVDMDKDKDRDYVYERRKELIKKCL